MVSQRAVIFINTVDLCITPARIDLSVERGLLDSGRDELLSEAGVSVCVCKSVTPAGGVL